MNKGIKIKLLVAATTAVLMTFSVLGKTSSPTSDVDIKDIESVNDSNVVDVVTLDAEENASTVEVNSIATTNDNWKISDGTSIYWVKTKDSLNTNTNLVNQVKLFASELATKVTGTSLPIIYGEENDVTENDIVLMLDSSLALNKQGYSVTLEGTKLKVSASDMDGLFYGCRYVTQSLILAGNVTAKTDSPDVSERALSLDIGRKYYTVDWIKNLIQEMSWSNMNALVLHFSEEMGLGLESKTYPWLAGRDGGLCIAGTIATDNRYITQDELREIAAFAKLYHVELIPSFDSPGHMNYIVKKYNEKNNTDIGNYYHYNNKTEIVHGSGQTDYAKSYSRGIDISNEEAVTFTKNLITEYANLFKELGCTKFDIGGDELLGWGTSIDSSVAKWKQLDHWKTYAKNKTGNSNAVAYDAFMLYMNDLYNLVNGLGYTSVRMWNDDALRASDTGWKGVVTLNTNVEVLYWTPTADGSTNNVWTYLNAGHKVYNYLNYYNYYVLPNKPYEGTNMQDIYEGWSPYVFDTASSTLGTGKNTSLGNANVLGSAFCIWCDNPTEDENSVLTNILPMIRANGAKSWDALAHESVAYSTFANNISKLGNYPDTLVISSEVADITVLKQLIAEYGNYVSSDYTVDSFEAYSSAVNAGDALLVSGNYTKADVDSACASITSAKAGLKENVNVNENLLLYKATFKSPTALKGKLTTLSIMASNAAKSFVIYDKDSGLVEISTVSLTNMKTQVEGTSYYYVKFKTTEKGVRNYEIYAVDAEGNRSAQAIEATLTVK